MSEAYKTSQQLEIDQLKLFAAIMVDISNALESNNTREPALQGPVDLLDYVEEELVDREPFASKANAEYVRAEAQRLLLEDPVLLADSVLNQAFADLRHAATLNSANNTGERKRTAHGLLKAPLENATLLVESGRYFDGLINFLIGKICDTTVIASYEDLLWSAKSLITSFVAADFSIEHVKSLASNIVHDPVELGGQLISKLPYNVSMRPFLIGTRFDRLAYNAAVRAVIESYTVRDRIRALSIWYREPAREYRTIVRIIGLRGLSEMQVDDVTFYTPLVGNPRFATCRASSMSEVFGEPDRMNAAVAVRARDYGSTKRKAITAVAEALDLLAYHIVPRIPLEIDLGKAEIVDMGGHVCSAQYGGDRVSPQMSHAFALNTDHLFDETRERVSELAIRVSSTADHRDRDRLRDSLRCLRRSVESPRIDDQLLEAWMALESLLGNDAGLWISAAGTNLDVPEKRIAAVVASLAVDYARWEEAGLAHNAVRIAVNNQRFNQHSDDVTAPDAFLDARFIDSSPSPKLVSDMAEDVQHVLPYAKEPLLRAKLERAVDFYGSASTAIRRLTNIRSDVQSEITIIYQQRNRYVHQARRRLELMTYYSARTKRYASLCLHAVMQREPHVSHQLIFQSAIDRGEKLLTDLHSGDLGALLRP